MGRFCGAPPGQRPFGGRVRRRQTIKSVLLCIFAVLRFFANMFPPKDIYVMSRILFCARR